MKDLTGQVFGDIQVISYNKEASEAYKLRNNHTRALWNCKCNKCGDESIKQGNNIVHITGSGCTACKGQGNLIGLIFGSFKILSLNEEESKAKSELYNHTTKAYNCECINCHTKVVKLKSELMTYKSRGTSGCKECNRVDLTGQKFGRLTVIGLAEKQTLGCQTWLCQCECGNTCLHETGDLTQTRSPVQSCGCLHSEMLAQRNKETASLNGDSVVYERLHQCWSAMKNRCNSSSNTNYHLYGGRGIKVCNEWYDWFTFKEWALSHGYQNDLTIDRIDVNGNYEPNNCRWTTLQEQANNTRTNKMLFYKDEWDTLANWCRRLNLDYFRTKARLNICGYTVEEAFELGRYELRTT